jgi:hypothetical protein
VKKLTKKYNAFLAFDAVIKQIPRLLVLASPRVSHQGFGEIAVEIGTFWLEFANGLLRVLQLEYKGTKEEI